MADELTQLSDAALVVAIGRYREEALGEAYRRYAGAVLGLSQRILGDRGRAEDVLQEVFLNLWNSPDRFDAARGTLRAFLLMKAHGRSVDVVRADAARRRRETNETQATIDVTDDVESQVWRMTRDERVRRALDTLTDDERRAIELTYFGGQTYREAAANLNEPEGTVKTRIRSGMRRMRTELLASGVLP